MHRVGAGPAGARHLQRGRLDNWQVGVFFKGVAGSGKSTVADIVRLLFPPHWRRSRATARTSSGSWPSTTSSSTCAPRCARTSPEPGRLAEHGHRRGGVDRHQGRDAVSVVWEVPDVLCGNELPLWVDASGSITRRIVLFGFRAVEGRTRTSARPHPGQPAVPALQDEPPTWRWCRSTGRRTSGAGRLPDIIKSHDNMCSEFDALRAFIKNSGQVGWTAKPTTPSTSSRSATSCLRHGSAPHTLEKGPLHDHLQGQRNGHLQAPRPHDRPGRAHARGACVTARASSSARSADRRRRPRQQPCRRAGGAARRDGRAGQPYTIKTPRRRGRPGARAARKMTTVSRSRTIKRRSGMPRHDS